MTWTNRIDKRENDMAHGITFVMHERRGDQVRAEVAVGGRKLHADGTVSLTLALDQHKYGDELIAQLFTKDAHRVAERRADGWTRVQIYLGQADEQTAAMLDLLARQIRLRLQAAETKRGFPVSRTATSNP